MGLQVKSYREDIGISVGQHSKVVTLNIHEA
jgi:hypothetical protein